jgi:L-fucose mutarotase/ribose pyranase (RbsD/FucU family)
MLVIIYPSPIFKDKEIIMLKKLLITLLPLVTLGAANTQVNADENYPAADFSPTVIYLDKSYLSTKDENLDKPLAIDSKYPASYFSPTVIYLDETDQSIATGARETSIPDPKYPAANFSPTVIYEAK